MNQLEALVAQTQALELIAAALAILTPRQRIVICMRFDDEMSFAEIGVQLEISEQAATRLHDRACGAMRRWFEAHGVDALNELI